MALVLAAAMIAFGSLALWILSRQPADKGGAQSGHLEKPIMKPSISRRDPINFGFGIVSGLSIGCPLFMLVGMIAHMIWSQVNADSIALIGGAAAALWWATVISEE
jgi:hypothetical protein